MRHLKLNMKSVHIRQRLKSIISLHYNTEKSFLYIIVLDHAVIVISLHTFSRAFCQHVIASNSDWFIGLPVLFMISQFDNLVSFYATQLKTAP